ncbi:hypothetical protein BD779DRAFT_1483351 [Infundibulicybe gibba]|nr:hypothetical protein BD779DRAFT_1483351 [Infundibulicybe gibba]
MSRQDKATTERFTKTLRELVKRPENKTCADCKRNDPRWASWNLGVFLCIRCSGIHRGMGTHISRVKSVDLDVWTPEQMESIQKWGNHLANQYWEAHLKPGHIPPEHKMESFIRSKYESKRWALDGPPPVDPSTLETRGVAAPPPAQATTPTSATPTHVHNRSAPNHQSTATLPPSQTRQLLSNNYDPKHKDSIRSGPTAPASTSAEPPPPAPENDLFSLDFHAPTTGSGLSTQSQIPKKDVKQDILSLFSTPGAPAPAPGGHFGHLHTAPQVSPWATIQLHKEQMQPQATSMMGTTGASAWGAGPGWTSTAPVPPLANDLWGNSPSPASMQQSNPFGSNDVWGPSVPVSASNGQDTWGTPLGPTTAPHQKKDDVFGDIWGGFK